MNRINVISRLLLKNRVWQLDWSLTWNPPLSPSPIRKTKLSPDPNDFSRTWNASLTKAPNLWPLVSRITWNPDRELVSECNFVGKRYLLHTVCARDRGLNKNRAYWWNTFVIYIKHCILTAYALEDIFFFCGLSSPIERVLWHAGSSCDRLWRGWSRRGRC